MRHFYNYKSWECARSRFYKGIDNMDEAKAIKVMSDHKEWGKCMNGLLYKWQVSCSQFLTDPTINKIAWIGQASMACYHNVSSATVRKCWFMLTTDQRDAANNEARKTLTKWREQCQNIVQASMF